MISGIAQRQQIAFLNFFLSESGLEFPLSAAQSHLQ